MIYELAELLATTADCLIIFSFMIHSLSFKSNFKLFNGVITVLFCCLLQFNILFLNNLTILEGLYTAFYIFVLFGYARVALNGNWWKQLLMSLIGLATIFLVNTLISVISAQILHMDLQSILQMRNPSRILFLILSKITLIGVLIPIVATIRKSESEMSLHPWQATLAIISLFITIIVGIIIENLMIENFLPPFYASIIMGSLIVIDTLTLIILNQTLKNNTSAIKQAVLETRLHDEQAKLQEAIKLSESIKTLRHDMDNHILAIKHYIESNDNESALNYLSAMSGNLLSIPTYSQTNNQTIDAILNVKRIMCNNNNIKLKCYIDSNLPEFNPFTFNTVFGNLIDNAIEAESNISDKEIRLSIGTFSTYLHLIIQNRINKQILLNGELPNTTKRDVENHGIGLISVKNTISKCDGSIEFYEHDNWFVAEVLLPINKNI